MEAVTKGSGRMVKRTAVVSFTMLMEISMRETGTTTKLMEMVPTHTRMEPSMSDRGRMTSSMASVLKHGLMEPSMKVNTMRVRRMVEESLPLQMDQYTKENSK